MFKVLSFSFITPSSFFYFVYVIYYKIILLIIYLHILTKFSFYQQTLRTAVILYLGSILIISSMKIIMWWFLEWVTSCVSECVTIVMVLAVCLLTRPRLNGVFSPRYLFIYFIIIKLSFIIILYNN